MLILRELEIYKVKKIVNKVNGVRYNAGSCRNQADRFLWMGAVIVFKQVIDAI